MYILTNGNEYVMKNPVDGAKKEYIHTTNPNFATKFDYRTARNLIQSNRKALYFIKEKHMNMVDADTGKVEKGAKNYKGNGGIYLGKNNVDFDNSIIDIVCNEAQAIFNLNGWSMNQLKTYEELLNSELSRCDSAESDINHALEKFTDANDGKRPQAHKMSKIGYILSDIRDKRKNIKQCLKFVRVMESAIENKYPIEKLKLELSKAKYNEYKGRTEYYQMVLDILG